jgi:hypothetical protein
VEEEVPEGKVGMALPVAVNIRTEGTQGMVVPVEPEVLVAMATVESMQRQMLL